MKIENCFCVQIPKPWLGNLMEGAFFNKGATRVVANVLELAASLFCTVKVLTFVFDHVST